MNNSYFNNESQNEIEKIAQTILTKNPNLEVVKSEEEIKMYYNGRMICVYQFWENPDIPGELGSVIIAGDNIKNDYEWLKSNEKFFGNKIESVEYFKDEIDYVEVYLKMTKEKKYAKIIDKGECLSTIGTNSQFHDKWKDENTRLKSNKEEWIKFNFYPQNDMVGEVIDNFHNHIWGFNIFILKINENIFVPLSEKGIEFISYNEFIKNPNAEYVEDNSGNVNLNQNDKLLTDLTTLFRKDLIKNFTDKTNNFTRELFIEDSLKEAEMYSCDMILEFKKKSGFLTDQIIEEITIQVCESVSSIFKEFKSIHRIKCLLSVKNLIKDDSIELIVNQYYNRG